jgi:putative CocE/NonD family hydrolase
MPRLRRESVAALALVLLVAASAAAQGREYVQGHYTKFEYEVPMRDGVRLFLSVYVPKYLGGPYPIMLERTPYSIEPYGIDSYADRLGPSEAFARERFIFAYQDVRGRFMSEGEFVDMRPHRPDKKTPRDTDESTGTWDTIDWRVRHVPNNNVRFGLSGISYAGCYVAARMSDAHPALKAASPQAPVADCYFGDDCYHNGVLWLPHNFSFYTFFEERAGGPARPAEVAPCDYGTPDGYDYYLRVGSVARTKTLLRRPNRYWNNTVDHTTYDDFWKARSITNFFRRLPPSVMTVGGWFDAEDLSGALRVFRAAEKVAPTDNHLVMGPWQHGGWAYAPGDRLGNLYFASKTGEFYRERIEFPFFLQRLKDTPNDQPLPKAWVFQTGSNRWRQFAEWPPRQAAPVSFYLSGQGGLSAGQKPSGPGSFDEYVSDPARPVPFVGFVTQNMPSDYMTEDQRFAAKRPDVLVYQTEVLADDLSVAGPVEVKLFVSTTGTDSDFVVKVIDVYPGDHPDPPPAAGQSAATPASRSGSGVSRMSGYQQLVRGEPFRGKYRNSFETPEPFEPGRVTTMVFTMPDVCHTFRKGHRLMVQIQSSWFPLGDRNPQTFTDIPNAKPSDFRRVTQRVYRAADAASAITLMVER